VQSKVLGEATSVAIPQASPDPLSISVPTIVTVPEASNCTVMGWQIAVGGVMSWTVTMAVQVLIFPLISVTVNTTLFGPTLLQVKAVGEAMTDCTPHASFEPLSISAPVIEALPAAFSCIVISWQMATGGVTSSTVTTALQVVVLPPTSLTCRVTVLGPTLAQVNAFGVTVKLAIPQLSELPLSTSAPVIDTLPVASSCTVISWQTATGGTMSSSVITTISLLVYIWKSLTMMVYVLALRLVKMLSLTQLNPPSMEKLYSRVPPVACV